MRNYIKEIGSHGVIYSISNILTKAIGLILIPVYAKHLTVSDYGILSIITPFTATILVLFDFGLKGSYTRFYFDHSDRDYQRKLLGNILFVGFIIAATFFILLMFFGKPFVERLFPGIPFVPFFRYALMIAFFSVYYEMLMTVYRAKRQSINFGIFSVIKFTMIIVFTIILIIRYNQGALGKVMSEFYVSAAFLVICLIPLLKEARFEIDTTLIKNFLKYALPIVPHALSAIIVRIVAQLIINKTDGLDATAIYNMGFLIGSIISLIAISINQSWAPLFMKMATRDEVTTKKVFSQLSTYFALLLFTIAFFLIVYSENIVLLLANEKYAGSIAVVPIVIISFTLSGIYFIFANCIMVNKSRVKLLPVLTISFAVVNIIANILLVGRYGIVGAAYAHLISNFYLVIVSFFLAQRSFKMDYEFRRILMLTVSFAASFLVFRFIDSLSINFLFAELVIKFFLALLPLLLLIVFRFFRKSEIANLLDIYRKTKKQYLGT